MTQSSLVVSRGPPMVDRESERGTSLSQCLYMLMNLLKAQQARRKTLYNLYRAKTTPLLIVSNLKYDDHRVSDLNPSPSFPPIEASLRKTLNPRVPPMVGPVWYVWQPFASGVCEWVNVGHLAKTVI